MNSTSSSSSKDAVRIFRPWDSRTWSKEESKEESEEKIGPMEPHHGDWRVPPVEWTDMLESYWLSFAGDLGCPSSRSSAKTRPKRFKCSYCNVTFSNNGQLRGHIRIHTGERPFKCEADGCGKAFTRNEELTRHKRIHSGVRPFSCAECGKAFGRKDHLKKHSRTHMRIEDEFPPTYYPYPYLFTY